MEYLKQLFKKTGWISILESVIFLLLGIILVWKPEGTVKVILGVLGLVCIIAGVYRIVRYFMTKGNTEFFNYDIIYGIMSIVIGIIAMVYMNVIGAVFRIIIGVWIVYTSLVRINSALKIKKIDSGNTWIYSMILAIVMLVCGLFIILNSGAIMVTIGAVIIAYSIIDLIENIIIMQSVNKIM